MLKIRADDIEFKTQNSKKLKTTVALQLSALCDSYRLYATTIRPIRQLSIL